MNGPQVTLEALLSALNAHDLDAVTALAPDNERFRESYRRMLPAFPDVPVDAEWTVADAHKAVAWGHITGTHRGEWRGIIALDVDAEGRVTDFWLVNDWLGIATQIGATRSPPPVWAISAEPGPDRAGVAGGGSTRWRSRPGLDAGKRAMRATAPQGRRPRRHR
jgi:hypothetical protein